MRALLLSRRGLVALLSGVGLAALRQAGAQTRTEDRGLGGTGAVPEERQDGDRGIGGTGVIGTIRRFGSIVVNDLRIGFPKSVTVLIDGRRTSAAELRIGHVVQVVAHRANGRLTTDLIEARSEVVGPIDAVGPDEMRVLGQRVDVSGHVRRPHWRTGETVAVSGLRRIDGTIAASLVERRPNAAPRLAGPCAIDDDGVPRIAGMRLRGVGPSLAGRRVAVVGRLEDGALRVESLLPPAFGDLPASVSIEAYVARMPNLLRLGSGLSVLDAGPRTRLPEDADRVRAIVAADVDADGTLRLRSLRVTAAGSERGNGRRGGAPTGPSGFGPPGLGPPGLGPPGLGPAAPVGLPGQGPFAPSGLGQPVPGLPGSGQSHGMPGFAAGHRGP